MPETGSEAARCNKPWNEKMLQHAEAAAQPAINAGARLSAEQLRNPARMCGDLHTGAPCERPEFAPMGNRYSAETSTGSASSAAAAAASAASRAAASAAAISADITSAHFGQTIVSRTISRPVPPRSYFCFLRGPPAARKPATILGRISAARCVFLGPGLNHDLLAASTGGNHRIALLTTKHEVLCPLQLANAKRRVY